MRVRPLLPGLLLLVLFLPASTTATFAGEVDVLGLEIGDPSRKGREVDVVLDAITDARTGALLTPSELADRLATERLVFVGETHTSMEVHRIQLRLIEELHARGREVLIGFEMYPYTKQESLDHWVQGLLTEQGFIELSNWYESWGHHWDYYRDIFLFARDNVVPIFGLNVPRKVVSAVGSKGLENLSDEEREHLPESIDTDNEEHLKLFKSYFEEGDMHASMSDEQWERMFAAQCTWDAVMAHNSIKVLEERGPEAMLVVLVGQGHLAFDLGIQRQARQWFDGKMATVIPIPVRDEDGEDVDTVRASYADFVWGLPPVTDALYPSLGLSSKKSDDDEGALKVIFVQEESVAEKAGFQMGDVLLTMDGSALSDKAAFSRLLAGKRWGDIARFRVRRGEETTELTATFRRERDDDEEEDEEEEHEDPDEEEEAGHEHGGAR